MRTIKILLMILLSPCIGIARSNKQDLTCLTQAVYFEARGESYEGRLAVANVVMNRYNTGRYKSVCDVTAEKSQFSWWNNRRRKISEKAKWEEAFLISESVYYGLTKDNTNGATFFHEKKIRPRWSKKLTRVGVIGSHVFYSLAKL